MEWRLFYYSENSKKINVRGLSDEILYFFYFWINLLNRGLKTV